MKCLLILTLDIKVPEDVAKAMDAIDPKNIPHFAGKAHIVIDPFATEIENWLAEDSGEKHD